MVTVYFEILIYIYIEKIIYLDFVYVVFTLLHQRFRNVSMSIKSKQWFSVVKFFDKNEERSLPRNV